MEAEYSRTELNNELGVATFQVMPKKTEGGVRPVGDNCLCGGPAELSG